ncbi:hypothetical protein ABW19_dt0209522 [Dactylella cylindrospora]|nr:hypothetical protein ABW19_dt0209522 [Dactylella cylindrospora]
MAAIQYIGASELADIDDYNSKDNVKPVNETLVVEYSDAALSVTLLRRVYGMLYPVKVNVEPKLGEGEFKKPEQDEKRYLKDVQDWIETSIGPVDLRNIDYLVLTGDAATNTKLHGVLKTILKDNPYIRQESYERSAEDCVYGGARFMARTGREWMKNGLIACIPSPSCPQGEEDPDDTNREIGEKDGGQKLEL